MKAKDVMTKDVWICGINDNLATAVRTMWMHDCGVLPVVDKKGEVIGVLTDRDICIAAGSRNRAPTSIAVNEIVTRKLYSCLPDADIREALAIMRQRQVRRLPVIDNDGKLCGILSLDDIAIKAREAGRPRELSVEDVERTFESICRRASQKEAA